MTSDAEKTSKMIDGLRSYLMASEMKGRKATKKRNTKGGSKPPNSGQ
jgi:hypothetical protein